MARALARYSSERCTHSTALRLSSAAACAAGAGTGAGAAAPSPGAGSTVRHAVSASRVARRVAAGIARMRRLQCLGEAECNEAALQAVAEDGQTPAPAVRRARGRARGREDMAAWFDRIDTFILRVSALDEAIAWYAGRLGLEAAYVDPDERLAVLPLPQGPGLTLWELK